MMLCKSAEHRFRQGMCRQGEPEITGKFYQTGPPTVCNGHIRVGFGQFAMQRVRVVANFCLLFRTQPTEFVGC
jgi:hypothetical protein